MAEEAAHCMAAKKQRKQRTNDKVNLQGVLPVMTFFQVGLTLFLPPLSNAFRLSVYQLINPLIRSERS